MIAVLHLVNGETVVLDWDASRKIRKAIEWDEQWDNYRIHGMMIDFDGYSYGMWNVVKIEWLSESECEEKYVTDIK
jgi:hypothetical protein